MYILLPFRILSMPSMEFLIAQMELSKQVDDFSKSAE